MIIEDYCSFETAMLLKEKGFDAELRMYWNKDYKNNPVLNCCPCPFDEDEPDGIMLIEIDNSGRSCDSNHWWHPKEFDCIAPTLQITMKWLREVHKIGIFPSTYTFTNAGGTEEYHPYGTAIINLITYELMTDDIMPRNSYEQACEAAIKYCLENLI